jgi:hypothetical protein
LKSNTTIQSYSTYNEPPCIPRPRPPGTTNTTRGQANADATRARVQARRGKGHGRDSMAAGGPGDLPDADDRRGRLGNRRPSGPSWALGRDGVRRRSVGGRGLVVDQERLRQHPRRRAALRRHRRGPPLRCLRLLRGRALRVRRHQPLP